MKKSGETKKTAFRWYLSFLKKYRVRVIIGLILVAISSVLILVSPKVSGLLAQNVIEEQHYDQLGYLLLALVGATSLRAILRYVFLMLFESSSQGLIYDVRDASYGKLIKEDFSFFNSNRTGDLMSRQTGDIDAVRHFTSHVIYFFTENVLVFFFALFMIFSESWKLGLCMLVVLPFTLYITLSQSKRIKPAFEKARAAFASLNAFAQETISGNRVVKAFAKEDFEMEKFMKENDGYRDAQIDASKIWMKYIPLFEIASQMLTVILIIFGGYMTITGEINLGSFVTVSGYLWMLNSPLRQAGWIINDVQRFFTSIEKIYSTYSVNPEITVDPCQEVHKDRILGDIQFKNVDYYAFDSVILRDINFHVKPGQTVGIIGATGSGKSTLINLISRFYDVTNGEVLIDGEDVRKYPLALLRGSIGVAMQDVFLFSDTIEGNIAYGNPDCTFEEVEKAAKIANADQFIREMPEGYDTIIGERGVGLSGGQKQRISLARAIVKNPSIVILDDTTSAIDMETESYIQQELKAISKDRTVLIIAHRISSIMDADQILVLDNGRIVESGNHQQLLDKKGYYYTVFNHQYGEFNEFKRVRCEKGRGECDG